jgi:methyl-accepting chemotaxis protein
VKITTQLRIALGSLAAVAVITTLILEANTDSTKQDGNVVAYSAEVEGNSQRAVKLALANQPFDQLLPETDKVLLGLREGSEELDLPSVQDAAYRAKLQEVTTEWGALKELLKQAQTNASRREALVSASERFFEQTTELTRLADENSVKDVVFLETLQWASLLVTLGVLAFIGFFLTGRIVKTLKGLTTTLASSSSEIAASMAQQEKVLASQASSVTQTTTMEELGASSRQAAEQADASAAGARQALDLSENGVQIVNRTMSGIGELKGKVGAIADKIMQLSEQTAQIATISDLVSDIAGQTNMLALNAAVEAARAGEQGKGFSVVAGEIRKLADQSKQSAEKINILVSEIQASINSTVMVTDEGNKTAIEGIKLAESTAESFSKIADAINNVFLNSQQIALSSKQQAVGVQQAVSAMNAINMGARESASGIGQVQTASQHLADSAKQLQEVV